MDYQGEYYKLHKTFHSEDAPRKFDEVAAVLSSNFKPKKIVDLGCGGGYVTRLIYERYKPEELVAVDISDVAIHHAKKEDKINIIKYMVRDAFKFNPKNTDLVVITDLVEHVKNPSRLLGSISKYSPSVVVRVPLERTYVNTLLLRLGILDEYSRFRKKYGHLHHYAKNEFASMLEKSGWSVENYKIFPLPKRSYLPLEILRLLFYPLYLITPLMTANLVGGFLVIRAKRI